MRRTKEHPTPFHHTNPPYRFMVRVLCPSSVRSNHHILATANKRITKPSTSRQVLSPQILPLELLLSLLQLQGNTVKTRLIRKPTERLVATNVQSSQILVNSHVRPIVTQTTVPSLTLSEKRPRICNRLPKPRKLASKCSLPIGES